MSPNKAHFLFNAVCLFALFTLRMHTCIINTFLLKVTCSHIKPDMFPHFKNCIFWSIFPLAYLLNFDNKIFFQQFFPIVFFIKSNQNFRNVAQCYSFSAYCKTHVKNCLFLILFCLFLLSVLFLSPLRCLCPYLPFHKMDTTGYTRDLYYIFG